MQFVTWVTPINNINGNSHKMELKSSRNYPDKIKIHGHTHTVTCIHDPMKVISRDQERAWLKILKQQITFLKNSVTSFHDLVTSDLTTCAFYFYDSMANIVLKYCLGTDKQYCWSIQGTTKL